MGSLNGVKKAAAGALCALQVDRALRWVNRTQLLVVMYHGVTRRERGPLPWTQLPADVFSGQVEFLAKNYRLIALSELVDYLRGEKNLPLRSALITFDDGLRNNLTVAFPILARFGAPAVIFLATDLIGEKNFYWFDDLYLMLTEDPARDSIRSLLEERLGVPFAGLNVNQVYWQTVEHLKRVPEGDLLATMRSLDAVSQLEREDFREDFSVLDWPEIRQLHGSGLVEFGVHTAGHRILTGLDPSEWEVEIKEPRRLLSRSLGEEVVAFAYPNGRPGTDYGDAHKDYLSESGYLCAFSTEPRLGRPTSEHGFEIGRLPAGNDLSSESYFFRLMCSGFPGLFRGG